MIWLIRNEKDRALFWSNDQGWVDICFEGLTAFNDQERVTSNLPIDGEWVDKDKLADNPGSTANLDLPIAASAHSDDHRVEVDFDAVPWFDQAAEQEILELAQCQWGGDYPADYVAEYIADQNAELRKMFDYISIASTSRNPIGFECFVDADGARAWLNQHRPHLVPIIARTDEGNEHIEGAQKAIETALKTIIAG